MKVHVLAAAFLLGTTAAVSSKNNVRNLNQEATADAKGSDPLRRVWVTYKKGQHEAGFRTIQSIQAKSLARDGTTKMEVKHNFPKASAVVVAATEADIKMLQSNRNVLSVVEDPRRYLLNHVSTSTSNVRHRKLLEWNGQATNYGIEMVQADLAREAGLTGAGIKVCVIDSGFDLTHEDFETSHFTGESLAVGADWSQDGLGHGTHVSGIIAAANNKIGLVGVAPDALIHSVSFFDADGFAFSSDLVDAAYRCRDAGAKIISMSLGGDFEMEVERDVFTELFTEDGILSIAAAGNSGEFGEAYSYPASYENVLSVGAIDRLKNVAFFSSYNDMVDLVAPGVDIWSTLPANFNCTICAEEVSSGYASLDGTSQAAPHVAGVAALLWSFDPSANVSHIHNALLASAEDLGFTGRDIFYGQGLVLTMQALVTLNATLSGNEELQDWTTAIFNPKDIDVLTCDDDEMMVSVNLKTDRYGNETFWEIVRDVDGFTVMSGAGLDNRKTYDTKFCLPSNCYTFTINDSRGDGMCCDYGEGRFTVTVDGNEVITGGNFTDSDTVSLGGNCSALSDEPKPELPPCVNVTLTVMTDTFPSETSIMLNDTLSGGIIWDTVGFPESVTEYTFSECIDPTGCYQFTISDMFGDGFCCGGGFILTYDGEVVLSGDAFGFENVYLLGDACENQI